MRHPAPTLLLFVGLVLCGCMPGVIATMSLSFLWPGAVGLGVAEVVIGATLGAVLWLGVIWAAGENRRLTAELARPR